MNENQLPKSEERIAPEVPYYFVSYAHSDSSRVKPYLNRLKADNVVLWYDYDLQAGSAWTDQLANKILHAKGFIAFLSKNYLERPVCKQEFNYAYSKCKSVYCIALEADLPFGENRGLEMLSTSDQILYIQQFANEKEWIDRLEQALQGSPVSSNSFLNPRDDLHLAYLSQHGDKNAAFEYGRRFLQDITTFQKGIEILSPFLKNAQYPNEILMLVVDQADEQLWDKGELINPIRIKNFLSLFSIIFHGDYTDPVSCYLLRELRLYTRVFEMVLDKADIQLAHKVLEPVKDAKDVDLLLPLARLGYPPAEYLAYRSYGNEYHNHQTGMPLPPEAVTFLQDAARQDFPQARFIVALQEKDPLSRYDNLLRLAESAPVFYPRALYEAAKVAHDELGAGPKELRPLLLGLLSKDALRAFEIWKMSFPKEKACLEARLYFKAIGYDFSWEHFLPLPEHWERYRRTHSWKTLDRFMQDHYGFPSQSEPQGWSSLIQTYHRFMAEEKSNKNHWN
jgi:hypothetical protein